MNKRIDTLNKLLTDSDILISTPENIRYYSGFTGEGYLIRSEGIWEILTDSRYTEQASIEAPDIPIGNVNGLHDKFSGGNDIAVEDSLPLSVYCKLPAGKPFTASDRLDKARQIKEPEEIENIAEAERIGDRAFSYLLGILEPGMTERQVANRLEFYMKEHGAEALSFDVIATSGPNSSMPHAVPTDRKLAKGDLLTLDFGCKYKGYCSDMTRTVAIGQISDEMKDVYSIVLDANMLAIDKIHTGMLCSDADRIARDYIAKHGYGDNFGHSLGHGVGLAIHEAPALSGRCETVLEENMIVTIEPGIYIPGRFGIRIEDLLVMTADGKRVLSASDKNLITI